MSAPRSVVIAGAGIGGLAAALELSKRGIPVQVLEQAERLEPVGSGLQLSPNASRVLIDLGLEDRLAPIVVAPQALNVMNARSGYVLARATLGEAARRRYGAPYWVIHRGDLHTVLSGAVAASPNVSLQLGTQVDDFAPHERGVTVGARKGSQPVDIHGRALVGADGLWSKLRGRLGHRSLPRFAGYTAWRALVAADAVSPALRAASVNLWLGRHAHLVHYPVRGGGMINLVAILRDRWREPGWSAAGERAEIVERFAAAMWHGAARELVEAAPSWLKWALYDCPPFTGWGSGPVTLLGDAAHPMLPFLAQGAAMAIEDAAVLAASLAATEDPATALRRYEAQREARTARTQRAARRNGIIYHMGGAEAFLRALALAAMRGSGLLRHYDWLYRWRPG
ncbi:MAG: FAD-dependent monooxygenase [Hyphomicrobiales bacterium]|nr:FAD-dependent monooxygenase [Hyphomicrobiales bacterium]